MFELRPYQKQALKALDDYWGAGGGHPLVSTATGSGKSVLIASLLHRIHRGFPLLRALVLVHVRELVANNAEHLRATWSGIPLGINSAGLGERSWDAPIIVGNIQSVFRAPRRLGARHLVVVDEAHLVPRNGTGMYLSTFAALREVEPNLRICGFTATPFRLDSGRLDQGDARLFDDLVFDYQIADGIRDGYLAPLSSKATLTAIDVGGVPMRNGEFVSGALERAANVADVVSAACDEIVVHGQNRKSWLVFCAGVRHAAHVRDVLRARGVSAEMIVGDMPDAERDRILAAFCRGQLRALTNVNVLTTGFNAPGVDLLAMLRPTLSTGLYVQMIGRGTRKAQGKRDCLVLDFAGNVWRHGPVDRIDIKISANASARAQVDGMQAKQCPMCHELNAPHDLVCSCCGHEFPQPRATAKHATTADVLPVLTGILPWLSIAQVTLARHIKRNNASAPPSLRVDYLCGLSNFSEHLSFERPGYAREMAERWWFAMGGLSPAPATVDAALRRREELGAVLAIRVERCGKFWNVVERQVQRSDAVVDITRNCRCSVAGSREAAATTPITLDDEVRF